MSLMDHTIVNVAIPILQRDFGAQLQGVQWVVTIYMLTQAAVIPAAPYLSRRFGEKRAYVWTLVAFLLGSLLCGFAWNLTTLILFRFVQGIGGGILLPMVMTLLYQTFEPHERGTASSVMGVPLMVAPVFGPLVGGYLVSYWGWQWAFFINVPLGIIAIVTAQRVLRATAPGQRTRFDGIGFVAAAGGSITLLYGISALSSGDTSLLNSMSVAVGVALIVGFVVVELRQIRRGDKPLLDLGRFSDRTFTLSVASLFCHSFVQFGIMFLVPVYLQTVRQQTPFAAGAIQGAQALATLFVLPIAGRMTDKHGARPIVLIGQTLFALTIVLMAVVLSTTTPIWILIVILALLGCSGALSQQISVAAMVRIAKDEHRELANASTLLTVLRSFAAPLGVAVLSSIVQGQSLRYRLQLQTSGIAGDVLDRQSSLLAMHTSFLIGVGFVLLAIGLTYYIPTQFVQTRQPLISTHNA